MEFFTIRGINTIHVLSINDVVWISYNNEEKSLVIKFRNGDKYELPNVLNFSEIANKLGLPKNSYKFSLVDDE
jgi:peroxiredoxin